MAVIPCGSKYFLTVVILILTQEAIAQESDVIVSPSCSSQSFRTLSQTPSLTSSHLSLILLPGNHSINSRLSFVNKTAFSLEGVSEETTFVRCTINSVQNDRSVNIQIQRSSRVSINKISFHGCNLSISDSNNINVSNTRFLNAYNCVLMVYNGFNITIDLSRFSNNYQVIGIHDGILDLRRSKNFAITRSNFTNNVVIPVYSAVISTEHSVGFISCCYILNNTVMESYGGMVRIQDESLVFVTNSTFLNNNFLEFGSSVILVFSSTASATVISSIFRFNTADRYGSAIRTHSTGNATVLACEFSHNRAGRNGYSIKTFNYDSDILIGCSQFHNNSNTDDTAYRDLDSNVQVLSNNSIGCSRYAIGEAGVCICPNCEGMYLHTLIRSY